MHSRLRNMRPENRFAVGFGAAMLLLFAGCGGYLFNELRYVNEPRIRSEDHAKERNDFAELVPAGATEFRLLYRNVDHPVDVFTYRSSVSLESVLRGAKKYWKIDRSTDGYAEIGLEDSPKKRRAFPYGQIWLRRGQFLIALSQYPDVRGDPYWQGKIRRFLSP